jgi:hypothetical protein
MAALTASPVVFDEFGDFIDQPRLEAQLAANLPTTTDVFILSHGWKNSFEDATELYAALLGQLGAVAQTDPELPSADYQPSAFGAIWPAKGWGNETVTPATTSVGLTETVYDTLSPAKTSPAGFRRDVLRLQQYLAQDRLDEASALEFRAILRRHADVPATADEQSLFDPSASEEGLEGITPSGFSARDVFEIFTYWQMKKRAGVVGSIGVRSLIGAVQERHPDARIHLIGHSFGCKVMLAAVAGPGAPLPRPVQTLALLQGAVSFEAMAERVRGTNSPGGYRAALEPARVDGPIVATFSRFDGACSQAYPLASRLAGQVGELEEMFDQYQALGAVGASGVGAGLGHSGPMRDVGKAYGIGVRGVWSIDGGTEPGAFITNHSDVRTPQAAWLICCSIRRR